MVRVREKWVDHVKVFACILVALGHFFQSMVTAGLMPNSIGYTWFIKTIYCFHVQLFLICSGYLYQANSRVNSVDAWKKNAKSKLLNLGVPYLVFSTITWLLKTVFSSAVNTEAEGLLFSLFIQPMSPYWYLYALFFMFLVTSTFSGTKDAALVVGIWLVLKGISAFIGKIGFYPVDILMEYGIWFVLGMYLHTLALPRKIVQSCRGTYAGVGLLASFALGSVLVFCWGKTFVGAEFLLGLLACGGILLVAVPLDEKIDLSFMTRYTMPVFLMHTIFAAGLRAVLFKMGIASPAIHVISGTVISFAGPVIAAVVMERLKLDFLMYPSKYLNKAKAKE